MYVKGLEFQKPTKTRCLPQYTMLITALKLNKKPEVVCGLKKGWYMDNNIDLVLVWVIPA